VTKTSIVTGATGALGGAVAAALAGQSGVVVILARDPSKGETTRQALSAGAARIELVVCDLSNPGSIRDASQAILAAHPEVNLLVNAAAVFERSRHVTPDGREVMFASNHLGPFLLTNLLLPALRAGAPSRIITVSAPASTHLDFGDLDGARKFRALHAFGASKSANLLFTGALARRTASSGVTPISFHPGLVKSGLMRQAPTFVRFITALGGKPPARAASALVGLGTDYSVQPEPGAFYKLGRPSTPPSYSRDVAVQDQLWAVSAKLVGISPS